MSPDSPNPEVQVVERTPSWNMAARGRGPTEETYESISAARFHEWQANWATLLGQIVPQTHPKSDDIKQLSSSGVRQFEKMLAILRAVKSDYESGFLNDLPVLIRAEVSGNYMAQAEALLAESYHVPAAVLAGAVLEDALRKLCDEKGIATTKPSGERRGINAMNDDLATRGQVYNAAKAHEIRAWADIRNDCAHGDAAKVKPEDVRRMIQGLRAFVPDYLR